jgi:hypothetical protein
MKRNNYSLTNTQSRITSFLVRSKDRTECSLFKTTQRAINPHEVPGLIFNYPYCVDDIECTNKKCKKIHIERKRLNICQFDVFFIPNKDNGCHFEDCDFKHPRRVDYEKKKEVEFDELIHSVVNCLLKDEDSNLQNDLRTFYLKIYSYEELENELVDKVSNIRYIVNQSQYLYSNVSLHTKDDYTKFMDDFMSILSDTPVKCQEFIDDLIKIVYTYPESLEECKVLASEVTNMYIYISDIKNSVIGEYYSTIHMYPNSANYVS